MKTSIILFLAIVLVAVTLVRADVDYFKQPASNDQIFAAGSSSQFIVAQLPDIDGQTIYANVYSEGRDELVMTIQSWSPGSVSDSDKNDFTFTWAIPSDLKPGRYFVKIDINNDQDDNDICRSKTFIVSNSYGPSDAGARDNDSEFVAGGGRPMGRVNSGMKTSVGPDYYNSGRGRYSGNNGGGRPMGYVNSGMKTSVGGRYSGNNGNNNGGGGGSSFSALHLRRAK